jgi:hypothetical protein
MTPYEIGFSQGEMAAFKDRRNRIVRCRPAHMVGGERNRGWWDGYEPRTEAWRLRGVTPSSAWWVERESETV